MKLLRLAIKNIWFRKWNNLLSLLLLSCGLALILLVHEYNRQAEEKLAKNLSDIDLVVGAKGSPLQLILSAIYQIDAPTGNIPLKSAQSLARNPMIKKAIPLAYGDNHQGFRILGTNHEYPKLYGGKLQSGNWWNKDLEVVLGYHVAKKLKLNIGDEFHGQHGFAEDEASDHGHYQVVGILSETQSVADQLILCSIGTVWEVHHPEGGSGHQDTNQEITALLLSYKSKMAAIQLPRMINQQPHLQAAAPAIEINRIYHLLNLGSNSLKYFGYGLLFLAFFSFFIQTLLQLRNRQPELALLRSFGAGTFQLIVLLMLEAGLLAVLAWGTGEFIARLTLTFFADPLGYGSAYAGQAFYWSITDLYLLLLALSCALLAILLQLRTVSKNSIPDLLKEN